MTSALLLWVRAFVFTQIVEAPIYRRMLGVTWPQALLPTTLTHPFVWFVFPWVLQRQLGVDYVPMVVIAELFAWLVEAAVLVNPPISFRRALTASLVANGSSVALGLASRSLFGAP